jgi:CspA family cold shock protein
VGSKDKKNHMANGPVKWFNTSKGFDLVEPETSGKDVFVHISAGERAGNTSLADAQKLAYDLESGRDALFTAQPFQHDPDLLLGQMLRPGSPPNVLHDLLGRLFACSGFLSHLHSLAVTMSQKPSAMKSNQMSQSC